MRRIACITLFACALVAQAPQGAQLDTEALDLMELLNTPITVASKKASTIREQPGIVSLVTRQDIQASGARDLIDVLMMVPGFFFAKDVQGAVGVGIRGAWGYEGKVLLLVDDHEINEPLYGNSLFGEHIPVDSIQRVEIIRGPGSAMYGGTAELAVVKITTRRVDDLKNIAFTQSNGWIGGTTGRRQSDLSVVKSFDNGKFFLSGHTGQAPRSNGNYVDYQGGTWPMAKQSQMENLFLSTGVEWYGYDIRILADRYAVEQRDHWNNTINEDPTIRQTWDTYSLIAKKAFALSNTLSLTPEFSIKRQSPWAADTPAHNFYRNKVVDRSVLGLGLTWEPNPNLNILFGGETWKQKGIAHLNDGRGYFSNPPGPDLYLDHVNYNGSAFYGQGLLNTQLANITLGARYEKHSKYGTAFVPRLGLTKVLDKWHFKFLWTKAFRGPFLESINIQPDLVPEKTTAVELEAGYQIAKNAFISMNLFHTSISKPITYWVDAEGWDRYSNYDHTGTKGAELDFKWQHSLGQLNLSYSYYESNDNKIDLYSVPADEKSLLAFPRHKIVINSTFRLNEKFHAFAGLVYVGERYAWLVDNGIQAGRLAKLDAVPLVNLNLVWKNFIPNLDITLGAYNALQKEFGYVQAYSKYQSDGSLGAFQPPLPAQSREFYLKLSYNF